MLWRKGNGGEAVRTRRDVVRAPVSGQGPRASSAMTLPMDIIRLQLPPDFNRRTRNWGKRSNGSGAK